MKSLLRAITPAWSAPFSLRLVTTCTTSGRSGRREPPTIASFDLSAINRSEYCDIAVKPNRRALPFAITHAEPSLLTVPSGASEIRLVSGPSSLVKTVISKGALKRPCPCW